MIRTPVRIAAIAAMAAASVLGSVGTATADPVNAPESELVPLVCTDGTTYTVVVNGNGDFTPGHDADSTAMLIPTGFGPFHGVITDEDGNVVDEFTDPAVSKGSSTKPRGTATHCTFSFTETFTIPELGLVTFHGTGSVDGFVTPVH